MGRRNSGARAGLSGAFGRFARELTGGHEIIGGIPAPTSLLKISVPCDSAAGDPADISGLGNDLLIPATLTAGEVWAAAQQVSLPGGNGKYVYLDDSTEYSVDIGAGESGFAAGWFKAPVPGANGYFFGKRAGGDWLHVQVMTATGRMQVWSANTSNQTQQHYGGASAAVVADNEWHHLAFAIDGEAKSVTVWMDKKIVSATTFTLGGSTKNDGKPLCFGATHSTSVGDVGGSTACIAMGMRDFRFLKVPQGGFSGAINKLPRKLYHNMGYEISWSDL